MKPHRGRSSNLQAFLATLLAATHGGCLRAPVRPVVVTAAAPSPAVDALWRARGAPSGAAVEFPLGPGDLLELSVPRVAELSRVEARVGADGSIALPLLGAVPVGGATQPQLTATLRQRLATFMYQPEFSLFVKEYKSRQVAVVGEVARPGLYSITTHSETIRELVNAAGGFKEAGTTRILFFPSRGSSMPRVMASEFDGPSAPGDVEPLVLDLDLLTRNGEPTALALPVRPGDVIHVPEAGRVFVQGWVQNPGPVTMMRGLTVLSAVTAVGGTRYPAAPHAVNVLRSERNGERSTTTVNLDRIRRGIDADLPMHPGDIVDVGTTAPRLASYWMYEVVTTVVKVGASIPLI